MNFKPTKNRVLCYVAPKESKTESGVILPDSVINAIEDVREGTVVAIGKDVDQSEIKVGDTVLFTKFADTVITLDGKQYLLMIDEDIYGTL